MKYLLMYNPKSGKGKIQKDLPKIQSYFEKKALSLEIHETTSKEDAKTYLSLSKTSYDCVIAAGGDGTISTIVNGMMALNKKPILAVLPYGSANDIAHILGYSKNLKVNLKRIIQETPVKMDINKMNDIYFVYTAAAGLFTKISYDIPREHLHHMGQIAYYIEGIKDLTTDYDFDMTLITPKKVVRNRYTLVLGLAANRVGGIPLLLKNDSRLDDGAFELHLFERKNIFSKFHVLTFFIRFGKKLKFDTILKSGSFEIKASNDVRWNADGEYVCDGNITIDVIPLALEVIASKKAQKRLFSVPK